MMGSEQTVIIQKQDLDVSIARYMSHLPDVPSSQGSNQKAASYQERHTDQKGEHHITAVYAWGALAPSAQGPVPPPPEGTAGPARAQGGWQRLVKAMAQLPGAPRL